MPARRRASIREGVKKALADHLKVLADAEDAPSKLVIDTSDSGNRPGA